MWVFGVIVFFSVLPLGPRQEDSPLSPLSYQVHSSYSALQTQVIFMHEIKWGDFRETEKESKREFQRLKVKQDGVVKMASNTVFQVADLSCIPKLILLTLALTKKNDIG